MDQLEAHARELERTYVAQGLIEAEQQQQTWRDNI
jgi:hypothetical protein